MNDEKWNTAFDRNIINAQIPDTINSPSHYLAGGIETIDFIDAKDLDYHLGNVVKYVSRAGKKGPYDLEDLRKAEWYLKRAIRSREARG